MPGIAEPEPGYGAARNLRKGHERHFLALSWIAIAPERDRRQARHPPLGLAQKPTRPELKRDEQEDLTCMVESPRSVSIQQLTDGIGSEQIAAVRAVRQE